MHSEFTYPVDFSFSFQLAFWHSSQHRRQTNWHSRSRGKIIFPLTTKDGQPLFLVFFCFDRFARRGLAALYSERHGFCAQLGPVFGSAKHTIDLIPCSVHNFLSSTLRTVDLQSFLIYPICRTEHAGYPFAARNTMLFRPNVVSLLDVSQL